MKDFLKTAAIWVFFSLAGFCANGQEGSTGGTVFRSAFPLDTLKNVAPSDVKVAADFLIRNIVNAQGYRSQISTPVNHSEFLVNMMNDEYDMFVIFSYDYLKNRDRYEMIPQFVASHGGTDPKQSILLLTKSEEELSDVKGGKLMIQSGAGELVKLWLRNAFRKSNLSFSDHFSDTEVQGSVSKALLPVFFGKADAVVCLSKSFDLMKELNPQVGVRLKVRLKSEPLLSTLLCMRAGFREIKPGTIRRVGLDLHNSPEGSQLLTLMGVEKFVPFDGNDLAAIAKLLEEEEFAQEHELHAKPNDSQTTKQLP